VSRLRRVLAAVDFSEPARAAFDHALALSRGHGAELMVVHAVPTDWPFTWQARERRRLIGSLRAAANAVGVRLSISVDSGDPADVILKHAVARQADVIVLGASKRAGFDRFRFGSVAETVAVEAKQPVLVIPAAAEKSAGAASFRSILVAVDFGEGSTAAVAKALSMAGDNTRVTVVHVVSGVPLAGVSRYMYRIREPEFQRQLARDAWRRMPEIIPANGTVPKVHARVVIGDPTAEISRVAREANADLILVGVTPRGALGRLLFGSTAARVIRNTGVPVLAMPQVAERVTPPSGDDDEFSVAA
jgi:nucleotide-binding universal stress UspA family protein